MGAKRPLSPLIGVGPVLLTLTGLVAADKIGCDFAGDSLGRLDRLAGHRSGTDKIK